MGNGQVFYNKIINLGDDTVIIKSRILDDLMPELKVGKAVTACA